MITFVKSDINQIYVEQKIFNSNTEYNSIAFNKKHLENKDILDQYSESEKLKTERYLVSKDESIIGILEYGMSSPRAKKPWLSLLIIDNRYQGQGYAKETYYAYENLMKDKQVESIQIAVHAINKKALNFWTTLGFEKYDERLFEGNHYYSLEKQL
ncbi:GNAT family N-acetyltransferase [Ornithinibacillus xuwenensis]|uniref:GNAT family N-acetyltransferase n=1 Tax=Ornithinibacillus xuwenensis TaxID=3144668 RepID=A0ABU9XMD5_9BACI